jgi:hypothetical protein
MSNPSKKRGFPADKRTVRVGLIVTQVSHITAVFAKPQEDGVIEVCIRCGETEYCLLKTEEVAVAKRALDA